MYVVYAFPGPTPSECGNYQIFDVVMTDAQLARFQAALGRNRLQLKQKTTEDGEENKVWMSSHGERNVVLLEIINFLK